MNIEWERLVTGLWNCSYCRIPMFIYMTLFWVLWHPAYDYEVTVNCSHGIAICNLSCLLHTSRDFPISLLFSFISCDISRSSIVEYKIHSTLLLALTDLLTLLITRPSSFLFIGLPALPVSACGIPPCSLFRTPTSFHLMTWTILGLW